MGPSDQRPAAWRSWAQPGGEMPVMSAMSSRVKVVSSGLALVVSLLFAGVAVAAAPGSWSSTGSPSSAPGRPGILLPNGRVLVAIGAVQAALAGTVAPIIPVRVAE